ncbi:MAG: DNA-directed RNA polymerase subunit beta' [Candidatus Kerfeldbacteria bacterium]|nr:DNA-directed RNA polymerase subunit beta' [Candidatus Kerfeldbacteria bacterium]
MSFHDNTTQVADFSAIRLKLASPDDIHKWSYGEVLRPETINYRTQKPEKDGLFCEKIFGPSKDWECYCGKYKRIRYKGIVCDKCGVEVTRSIVRRDRMGHIDLAAPVTHIWFLRGVPSKIGLLLNLSTQSLEKVVYFANYIISDVNDQLREQTLAQIESELEQKKKLIRQESSEVVAEIKKRRAESEKERATMKAAEAAKQEKAFEQELINAAIMRDEKVKDIEEAASIARKELQSLAPLQIVSESQYYDLSLKYGHVFEAAIGAEAIHRLLARIDLTELGKALELELAEASKNQQHRLRRRLKLVKNLQTNGIKPEWMIMRVVPIIPPDLRPMVQLDGGRFASSDLNDLYRRVINRNNRLKRLQELNAPEVIQRNEKRMLQEAVDALIDNSARHGKTVTASTGQKRQLKSLADMLKGKQGRFRQNLLGKRVDYSGRSVIVVGPHLKLNQCGLPKKMALELFKSFVIAKLIEREYVYNVRSANRFIESNRSEVWDILEEVTKDAHVLLNRAPTLHRLGIQAFQPLLIEGKAIQVHPLVCPAFNADFDGDQMAVHVPLSKEARKEAKELMLSTQNLLKPATGEPIVTPSQDIVLGTYYLTFTAQKTDDKELLPFATKEEVLFAYQSERIGLQQLVKLKMGKEMVETSPGRIIFNEILPKEQQYVNEVIDKKGLKELIADCLNHLGQERTVQLLDDVKDLAIEYVTQSGMSWGMDDLIVPEAKYDVIKQAELLVDEVYTHFNMGLLTDEERRAKVIEIWTKAKNDVTIICQNSLDRNSPAYSMINSGARGSWGQTTQMMGMKGLVINPSGETIELPVKANFKEGFDVLEYFISTHGARKGLSDTALRTANAGYLTRRLVDVAQDVVIVSEDCGAKEGVHLSAEESEDFGTPIIERVWGRTLVEDLVDEKGKVLVGKGELVETEHLEKFKNKKIKQAVVRSVLTCLIDRGVCQKCYGYDLGHNRLVAMGTAAGIIAAQSIGEPGTQLTMRTFHTGGVAGADITQGLPRVEELFEARPLKKAAIIADVDGTVTEIVEEDRQKVIRVEYTSDVKEKYTVKAEDKVKVKDGAKVKKGEVLYESEEGPVKARLSGVVAVEKTKMTLFGPETKVREFTVPAGYGVWVKKGELISMGQQLTEGSLDLYELYTLQGVEAVQKYIIKEIQYIYSSQGQKLNDKHIEVIIRQMFARMKVLDSKDTDLVVGDIVSKMTLTEANEAAKARSGKSAVVEPVLLGITKASLSVDSFLSAASFQETARILIDAAVSGKIDHLRGLKENVIIGKLIPVGTGFRG